MTIGERIKKKRLELGLSQEELARKIGYVSRASINKIELGLQDLPRRKVKAIADALDTTTDYIMGVVLAPSASDRWLLSKEEYDLKADMLRRLSDDDKRMKIASWAAYATDRQLNIVLDMIDLMENK